MVNSYTGTAASTLQITGVGFKPDFVYLHDGAQRPMWKISAMGANSFATTVTTGPFTDGILSLDSDGFTVGSNATVNGNGVHFSYIAIKDNGNGDIAFGSYTGNGVDARNVVVGFQPTFAWTQSSVSGSANVAWTRWSGNTAQNSMQQQGGTETTNQLELFTSNAFQVGTNSNVNGSGVTYFYFAIKDVTGVCKVLSYSGTGVAHGITGVGFQPSALILRNISLNTSGLDAFYELLPTVFTVDAVGSTTTAVTSFDSDGFSVGTLNKANGNGNTHCVVCFKTGQNGANPSVTGGNQGTQSQPVFVQGNGNGSTSSMGKGRGATSQGRGSTRWSKLMRGRNSAFRQNGIYPQKSLGYRMPNYKK